MSALSHVQLSGVDTHASAWLSTSCDQRIRAGRRRGTVIQQAGASVALVRGHADAGEGVGQGGGGSCRPAANTHTCSLSQIFPNLKRL